MRRGRPSKPDGDSRAPKPSPSPLRIAANDPWLTLDSISTAPGAGSVDEASTRFPALEDFSLLHDSGTKFAFDPNQDQKKRASRDISQRVTEALADDAFAQAKPPSKPNQSLSTPNPQDIEIRSKPTVTDSINSKHTSTVSFQQAVPQRSTTVSKGTMTSPVSQDAGHANRPIFRVPDSVSPRPSKARISVESEMASSTDGAEMESHGRPSFLEHRSRSQIITRDALQASQPSLETTYRSSSLGGVDITLQRSRSANSRARPISAHGPSKPGLLRRISRDKGHFEDINHESSAAPLISAPTGDADDGEDATKIGSNVDFLKAMEEEEASKRKEKRLSSGSRHIKRASMPSVSLSGTKNLLAGRFGDAFKRFETNGVDSRSRDSSQSPIRGASGLTPIAGSEATDGRSDDGHDLEETEEIPPEMRRELERRRLSQEEKRVADAAAAYRQRLAQGGEAGRGRPNGGSINNKAISIQSKVKTLLDESGRASPSPTKTASGYGRFTDSPAPEQPSLRQTPQAKQDFPPRITSRQPPPSATVTPQPSIKRKPLLGTAPELPQPGPRLASTLPAQPSILTDIPRHSAPPSDRPFTRPSAPPKPQTKPQNLRTGDRSAPSPAKPPIIPKKPPMQPSSQQKHQQQHQHHPPPSTTAPNDGVDQDWELDFSKRYPDLAGLEMVETELDGGNVISNPRRPPREVRVRDV